MSEHAWLRRSASCQDVCKFLCTNIGLPLSLDVFSLCLRRHLLHGAVRDVLARLHSPCSAPQDCRRCQGAHRASVRAKGQETEGMGDTQAQEQCALCGEPSHISRGRVNYRVGYARPLAERENFGCHHPREHGIQLPCACVLIFDLEIRGCVVTGPNARDRLVFLDISTPLWLKGMPNPRDDPTGPASQYHGKLSGDYHWPFSISLPKEVSLPGFKDKDDTVQTCHLPQTFLERTSQASVLYEFFVHIARSTFREDGQCVCSCIYFTRNKQGF